MHERDERAPAYLLGLQDELDSMGRTPPHALPAALLVGAGGIIIGAGVIGLVGVREPEAIPWIVIGTCIVTWGVVLARRAFAWVKRVRSLRHGIRLIEARQGRRERSRTDP
jgi:hypothetical protein